MAEPMREEDHMSESDDLRRRGEAWKNGPAKVSADLAEDADTATGDAAVSNTRHDSPGERVRQTPKPRRIKGTTAREERARKRMAEIKQWVLKVRARYPRRP
jgi:hypothetical protein